MVTVHDNEGNPYSVRMNGETVEIVNAMFSDGLIMEVADVTNNKLSDECKKVWVLSLKY